MSAFMVNTNVMAKAVTAILLNLDMFDCSLRRPMRKRRPEQTSAIGSSY
jgi:hypothetical protein